jgi:hypothetical protein
MIAKKQKKHLNAEEAKDPGGRKAAWDAAEAQK